jgi:signal transduction histidine kinase
VRLRDRLTELALRPGLPRRTVRLRLTLLYGGLFLVSGAALLAITYALVVHNTSGFIFTQGNRTSASAVVEGSGASGGERESKPPVQSNGPPPGSRPRRIERLTPTQQRQQDKRLADEAERQHASMLDELLLQSGIALGLMSVISIALGWLVAGRVLRPLRTITTAARQISATNLHERLELEGPDDELKELGDTFDDLLARLEAAFQSQRQFVANASHELRTPLARQRALVQVAIADPNATVKTLRAAHTRVLAAGAEQERLIKGLLTLTRAQRGLEECEPVDLARLASSIVRARHSEAESRGLEIHAVLSTAPTVGDPRLVESLLANLVDNALRYNVPGGQVDVTTAVRGGRSLLSISNTGALVPAGALERLFQPFQRLGSDRTRRRDEGSGLGLSIVKAIADAHDATIIARPQPEGGLHVDVSFPAPRVPGTPTRRAHDATVVPDGDAAAVIANIPPGVGYRSASEKPKAGRFGNPM